MENLTNDQKIELLKLSSTTGTYAGETHVPAETAIDAYKQFINAMQDDKPTSLSLNADGLDRKKEDKPLTQLERLIQEHAIYKEFFECFVNRKQNGPGKPIQHPFNNMKQKGFDVFDRLRRLDRGIPYYDPAWVNADKFLFTIRPDSCDGNGGDGHSGIGVDVIH